MPQQKPEINDQAGMRSLTRASITRYCKQSTKYQKQQGMMNRAHTSQTFRADPPQLPTANPRHLPTNNQHVRHVCSQCCNMNRLLNGPKPQSWTMTGPAFVNQSAHTTQKTGLARTRNSSGQEQSEGGWGVLSINGKLKRCTRALRAPGLRFSSAFKMPCDALVRPEPHRWPKGGSMRSGDASGVMEGASASSGK